MEACACPILPGKWFRRYTVVKTGWAEIPFMLFLENNHFCVGFCTYACGCRSSFRTIWHEIPPRCLLLLLLRVGERRGSTQPADARHGSAAPAGRGQSPRGLTDQCWPLVHVSSQDPAAAVRRTGRTDPLCPPERRQTACHQLQIHPSHPTRRSALSQFFHSCSAYVWTKMKYVKLKICIFFTQKKIKYVKCVENVVLRIKLVEICVFLLKDKIRFLCSEQLWFYLCRRRRLCFWFGLFVCLSVCPSDYSQTCERILTKFFGGVGHGSRTKWYNFGGDLDHASDPGVQSPKSGSSGSAEVCALWVLLVSFVFSFFFVFFFSGTVR